MNSPSGLTPQTVIRACEWNYITLFFICKEFFINFYKVYNYIVYYNLLITVKKNQAQTHLLFDFEESVLKSYPDPD